MHWQPNRLRLVRERALDRLFDPPRRVSAELAAFCRVKTFDRFHQTDVAFGNQVEQRQPEVRVTVPSLHYQPQVGASHKSTGLAIGLFDPSGELNLLLRGQERDLPDLAQVNLNSGIAIFSGHITSLHEKLGAGPAKSRLLCSWLAP